MKNFIRAFYRIFIKNRLIRWVWMLSLAVYGVYYASEHGIMKAKMPWTKTIFEINPEKIDFLTIRQNDDDMTFSRTDSDWLVVKNNITVRVKEDSVAAILNLLKKVESFRLKNLPTTEGVDEKALVEIFTSDNQKSNRTLSIFYTEKDSASGDIFTYIKLPNERLLHGVKGDWLAVLNKNFDGLRNNTLLNFNIENVTQLDFRTPLDTAIFTVKDTNFQYFDTRFVVLQNEFKNYIKTLTQLRGSVFYDNSRDFKERKNIENQIVIRFKTDSILFTSYHVPKGFMLHSTQNDEAVFKFDSTNLLFKDVKQFIRLKPKKYNTPSPF